MLTLCWNGGWQYCIKCIGKRFYELWCIIQKDLLYLQFIFFWNNSCSLVYILSKTLCISNPFPTKIAHAFVMVVSTDVCAQRRCMIFSGLHCIFAAFFCKTHFVREQTIYSLYTERSNVYASLHINLRQRKAINRDRPEDLFTMLGLSTLSNFTVDKITIEYY